MLPAAKIFIVTALLGGGVVGSYALAGGKFGTGGNGSGNAETTQVSEPEIAVPTVNETGTIEGEAPVSSSSSSTLRDNSQEESVSDASLGEGASQAGSEGQGQTKDDTTGKDGEIIAGAQGENEKGDIASGQSEGSQVPESLPTAPAERAQEEQESRGADDQVLPAAQPNSEDTREKTTKENENQGNNGKEGNKEQSAGAGTKSQIPSTDNENTNTATRSQEETGTASGGETVQQRQEPAAVGS